MKYELKGFQVTAVEELHKRLELARHGVEAGIAQAIILSSPTGSGKTVCLAALLESILQGDTDHEENPRATFLWVSDSPELNAQSLDKILRASDAFPVSRLVTVDAAFDQERFSPGHIYFINTSKLGKEKLLTRRGGGDKRRWTFWETVANTAAASPTDFVVVLDEAHRGMGQTAHEQKKAKTIVQKFIFGSEGDSLPRPGVPLLLGMSATPQRFDDLLAGTDRSKSVWKITTEDVRESGLLKDLILVQTPSEDTPSDLTLLQEATRRWKEFGVQWADYCRKQNLSSSVKPVLVVQVEDGRPGARVLTKTNLDEVIETIERVVGPLRDEEYAHCFQEGSFVEAGSRRIRKIEASRIQEESNVRVVLFKMSLTTGWDCPRAEVMMSFRRAQDHTLISQLIGRMTRTPLARRIEGSEVLNTVELFLPHYSGTSLNEILRELQNPDAESGAGTHAVSGREMVVYPRADGMESAFKLVESLPSYSIGRVPELPAIKRLLRLAGRLTLVDDIDNEALDQAREKCLGVLFDARDRLVDEDPGFVARVQETGELELTTISVQYGGLNVVHNEKTKIALSSENVDDLFERSGRLLGSGEGLHKEFWKRLYEQIGPIRPKLELHEILKDRATLEELNRIAVTTFDQLYARNQRNIAKLTSSARESYNKILGSAKEPTVIFPIMPPEIVVPKLGDVWKGHLYSNLRGEIILHLNSWEAAVVADAMKQPNFVGWLRNIDRKEWALAVPYDDRGIRPFYPDFIIFRHDGDELIADIIDPHDSTRDDTWAKAKGLAEYAEKHGHLFGRLELAIRVKNSTKTMDMNDPKVRAKAKKFQSNNDVEAVFS